MLNILKKQFSLAFCSLLLSGCGSGGETESLVSVDPAPVAPDIEPAAEEVPLEMRELVAAQDFSFTTKNNIQVDIALNDYQDQRAYLSIYSVYQRLDSGRYYPDSASRVIGGALQRGMFEHVFIGLNNQQQYLIEVWFYDGREPLQKVLPVNNKQLRWQ